MKISILKPIFWIAAFLILIEVPLEYRAYIRGWSSIVFGTPNPAGGSSTVLKDEKYGPLSEFPFRSLVVTKEKADCTLRYWIASSSMGEHPTLKPEIIFPNLLQSILVDKGHKSQILNASRAGYAIHKNIETLKELGPLWKPDIVILYNMNLDVNHISKRLFSSVTPEQNTGDLPLVAAKKKNRKWATRVVQNTVIYSHLQSQFTNRLAQCRILYDSLGMEGERIFEKTVLNFIDECNNLSALPVLCTFATSQNRTTTPWPEDIRNWLFRWNIYLSVDGWIDTIERFNNLLVRVAREKGVPIIDLQQVLGGKPEYFVDFVHFSPEGHHLVAEILSNELSSLSVTTQSEICTKRGKPL